MHTADLACCAVLRYVSAQPPQDLDPLSTLPHLTTLCLLGNPVALKKEYRWVLASTQLWGCWGDWLAGSNSHSQMGGRVSGCVAVWLLDDLAGWLAGWLMGCYWARAAHLQAFCSRHSMDLSGSWLDWGVLVCVWGGGGAQQGVQVGGVLVDWLGVQLDLCLYLFPSGCLVRCLAWWLAAVINAQLSQQVATHSATDTACHGFKIMLVILPCGEHRH